MDSWSMILGMMFGTPVVAPARGEWPPEFTRVVVADDWFQSDLDLEPLPKEPVRQRRSVATEEALLAHLADEGTVRSVRSAATALALPRQRVMSGLHRLRDRGLARLESDGWRRV